MTLIPQSGLRNVSGISDTQMFTEKDLIKEFMRGAVYCWVKNHKNQPGEPFAVHDLVGGVNSNWERTPLQVLYNKHINAGKDEESANKAAGIDLGWLVKTVLDEDKRTFVVDVDASGWVKSYRWDGNEP